RRRGLLEFQLGDAAVEPMREAGDRIGRQRPEQLAARAIAVLRDRDADAGEGTALIRPRIVQLVDANHQHIEFADGAEVRGQLAKPTGELLAVTVVELEHWHELAKAPRRDPGAVQRTDIALLEARERARETIEKSP